MEPEGTVQLTERDRLILRVASQLADGVLMPDAVDDFGFTPGERDDVNAIALYLIGYRRERERTMQPGRRQARRRALALIRTFLTDEQRRRMRASRDFIAVGSAGGVYRIDPYRGRTELVEKHGRKWFVRVSFCLHDYPEDVGERERVPPADLALQHLLLLRADEGAFLKQANWRWHDTIWSADWQRRVRRRREQLAAEVAQAVQDDAYQREADELAALRAEERAA